MRITWVLLACLVTLAACRGEDSTSASNQPSETMPDSPPPTSRGSSSGAQITGRFSVDSIEGGCAFLEAADGTRFEVIYPEGWTLLRNPYRLRDPAGQTVATGGEMITVRGRVASDMASTCMVGPIFRAMEVLDITR